MESLKSLTPGEYLFLQGQEQGLNDSNACVP